MHLSQDAATSANAFTPLGKHAEKLHEEFVASHPDEIDFSGIIQVLLNEKQ